MVGQNNRGSYGVLAGPGYGVYGSSDSGDGGSFSSGGANGVYAVSTAVSGNGVFGVCNNGSFAYGVYGGSTDGRGVVGASTNGYGGYFSTNGATGLYSKTASGTGNAILGENVVTGSRGILGGFQQFSFGTEGIGVYGESLNGYGVQGVAGNNGLAGWFRGGDGIVAEANDDSGTAVNAIAHGTNGTAIYASGFAVGTSPWYNFSDARLKRDIRPLEDSLPLLDSLRGVSFLWRREGKHGENYPEGRQIGFIAQEVESVFPSLVRTDAEGYKSVAYTNLIPVAVEAIKTLHAKVDALQKEIDELKAAARENADIKKQLAALAAIIKTYEKSHSQKDF